MLARLVGRCPICGRRYLRLGRRYLRLGRRADLVCRRCYEVRLMDFSNDSATNRMYLGAALADITATLHRIVEVTGDGTVTGVRRLAKDCLGRLDTGSWQERCR